MFVYKATVLKVYDADTFIANIDLGFNMVLESKRLRMHKVDAPKSDGTDDQESSAYKLRNLVIDVLRRSNNVVYLRTHKGGGHDKFTADVWISLDDCAKGWDTSLNKMCLDSGWAREFVEKR